MEGRGVRRRSGWQKLAEKGSEPKWRQGWRAQPEQEGVRWELSRSEVKSCPYPKTCMLCISTYF